MDERTVKKITVGPFGWCVCEPGQGDLRALNRRPTLDALSGAVPLGRRDTLCTTYSLGPVFRK